MRRVCSIIGVALWGLVSAGCGAESLTSQPTLDGESNFNGEESGPVPLTPTDRNRLAPGEEEAIMLLGGTGAGPPERGEGHSHGGSTLEIPLLTGDAAIFQNQWLAAQRTISDLDTLDEVIALGYVRASIRVAGIGSHWVHWSQIAKPFDPQRPAMVLFDERREPPVLVGYSYALSSPTLPEGFAGPNDHWHQHTGLCVDNGWVIREQAASAAACEGTYIAGGDFWMLHAWVVPGWENRRGKFAPFNPKLCPPDAGTPDISRCPE